MKRTHFGTKLRDELDRQGVSARELARRLQPHDPEGARRNVARWLAPADRAVNPAAASRRACEDALGLDPGTLNGEEDEEDSSMPLSRDEFAMLGALMSRLGVTLHDEARA